MTVERQIRFWLIGLVIFLVAVFVLRGILLPFIAGMAVAYLLDPTCDRFEKWGMSRTLATTLLTVMFLIVAVTAVLVFVPLLAGQVARLLERTPQYFDALRVQLTALLTILEARVDPAMFEGFQGAMAGTAEKLAGWLTGMLGRLVSGGVALANLFSLILITPVVAFYLLRDWDRLVARVDTWLPRSHVEVIREQAREVDRTLAGFLRGQGAVCLILGSFYAVGLTAAGLDFGLVIGLIAGVLTFIPYFGAAVGLVLSVGLALVQFDDWMRVAIVAGIFVIGQVIEGNFLTPKLVGESVGLHPVWVIFGLFAGGSLFGFVGVLLAIPITAVVGVGARFALKRYMQSPYYRAGEGRPDG